MTDVEKKPRGWKLFASRDEKGQFWYVGSKFFVRLHDKERDGWTTVPVFVEEHLGDPLAPEVTHHGWLDAHKTDHYPTEGMTWPRTGDHWPCVNLKVCFPYGWQEAVRKGDGQLIALRIVEDVE